MITMKEPQDFKVIAERVIQGEKVLIPCSENEKIVELVVITKQEYNQLEETRRKALSDFKETIKAMQEQSVRNGTSDMTMDEINAIITEVRQERKEQKR